MGPLGLEIDKDPKTVNNRLSDKRGYVDNDIPLLESFKILKDGKPPKDFYLSPDDYRNFIDWLINGPVHPIPPVPLRVLCYYRMKIEAGMNDINTTDGMRLTQGNLVKTIDQMIRGGDDSSDPIMMCATGGAAVGHPPTTECCEDIKTDIEAIKTSLEAIQAKPDFDIKIELQKLLSAKTDLSGAPISDSGLDEIKALIASLHNAPDASPQLAEILTKISAIVGKDYTANFEELKTLISSKPEDIRKLIEEFVSKHGDDPELVEKLKALLTGDKVDMTHLLEEIHKIKLECPPVNLDEIKTLIAGTKAAPEEIRKLIEEFISKHGDDPELLQKLQALIPGDNAAEFAKLKEQIDNLKLDCPPVDLEEIKTLIKGHASTEEIRKLIEEFVSKHGDDPELVKKLQALLPGDNSAEFAHLLEEIHNIRLVCPPVDLEEIKTLIKGQASTEEIRTLIEEFISKHGDDPELLQKLQALLPGDNSAEFAKLKVQIDNLKLQCPPVDLEEIKTLIKGQASTEEIRKLIEEFISKHGDDPELLQKLQALIPGDNSAEFAKLKEQIDNLKLDCPPVDLEEIKTLIKGQASTEEIRTLIEEFISKHGDDPELLQKLQALLPGDNAAEFAKLKVQIDNLKLVCPPVDLEEIKTLIERLNLNELNADISANLEEIKTKLDGGSHEEIKRLLEEIKEKEVNDPEILPKIKMLLSEEPQFAEIKQLIQEIQIPQINLEEIKTLIETTNVALSDKITGMGEAIDRLSGIVSLIANDTAPTLENTTSLLEKLGEARGNISRLLVKKPTSSLNIKANQITAKAAEAAQEAERALESLNKIKADDSKSAEEVEASVEQASNARNKADRLISEAQQLWELISPSEPDPGSAEANIAPPRNGVQVGGKGNVKEKGDINSAKNMIQALSESVSDAKRIIKEKRSMKHGNSEAQIRELREQIDAATLELTELRKRLGEGGRHLEEARGLEIKVQKLTGLLKQIVGERPNTNLEMGVREHLQENTESVREIAGLKAQLLTLTQQYNLQLTDLRTQLKQSLTEEEHYKTDSDAIRVRHTELQKAVQSVLEEHKIALAALQEQLRKCTQYSPEKDREIARLTEENAELEGDIVRLRELLIQKAPEPKQPIRAPEPKQPIQKQQYIPGNTESARRKREAAQEQLRYLGSNRTAHLPRYGARTGGKKGARLTRVKKNILPLE